MDTPAPIVKEDKSSLKTFDDVPGPKGLPLVGTLFDYFKKDGLSFDKMFEVMCCYFLLSSLDSLKNIHHIKEILKSVYDMPSKAVTKFTCFQMYTYFIDKNIVI